MLLSTLCLAMYSVVTTTTVHSEKLSVLEDMTVSVDSSSNKAAAYVEYEDLLNSTGWTKLSIQTNGTLPDRTQARAAGVGEGYVTATRILQSWINTVDGYCNVPSEYCDNLALYMSINYKWMQDMIGRYRDKSSYWYHLDLIFIQIEGLHQGFNMIYPNRLTLADFYLMNMMGDFIDLEVALSPNEQDLRAKILKKGDTVSREDERMIKNVLGSGHCSAFIKWLPRDLLVSHVTWNTYQAMIRIIKSYHFNFRTGPGSDIVITGNKQVFSSYPGFVFSGDDFTLISSGLVTQETTIGNFNSDLWKLVKSKGTVPEYMRSVVANRIAENGRNWCRTFEKFNSGTYNNQWMIIDYNLFTPGMPLLKPGTLYVLEQLPGNIVYSDRTYVLNAQKYWPSYNTPYYTEIFDLSGSQKLVDKFGPMFSYAENPRALIFKRDNHTVVDMESLYKLMRYNDYTRDPLSKCDCSPPYSAINAISSRSDLNPANGSFPIPILGSMLSGGIDYKATNSDLMKKLAMRAAAGPTWEQQLPFRWSTSDWSNSSHIGMADLQKFDEITVMSGFKNQL